MKITEGYMPFRNYKTYYRIVGEESSKTPLLLLHGGPGSSHNYFETLDQLAETGHQLIMYDQLGSGRSSIPDDPSLWTKETWLEELIELRTYLGLDRIHILGQSWGGMLALIYLLDLKPQGVESLILSSTLASASLWEEEQRRRIKFLPKAMQEAIETCEAREDYENPEYLKAVAEFMDRHCAGPVDENSPECLRREKPSGSQSYITSWGQSEFAPRGTLRDYEYEDRLDEIKIPTLITSGQMDLCSPYIAKRLYDRIENSSWELFQNSRHMPFVEENSRYIEVLSDWLRSLDQEEI